MLVAVGAALLDEHDLIDAGLLVAGEMRAQLLGGADAAAPGIVREPVLDLEKPLPKVGASGPVLAEERVIAERIAEEAEAVEPAADRFGLVRVARHAGHDRDVRVDAVADRHALL